MLSHETIDRIQPTDPRLLAQAQARLDRLTKPIGSLGRLEELAARYVMITGEMKPKVPRGAGLSWLQRRPHRASAAPANYSTTT